MKLDKTTAGSVEKLFASDLADDYLLAIGHTYFYPRGALGLK